LRYRNQWVQFQGAPTTYSLIADTKWKTLGLGFSVNHDKIGIEQITTPDLNLSYHVDLKDKKYFSMGMKIGANFIKANFANLVNVDVTDPLYTSGGKATVPYLGLGMLYYSPKFYIGLSSPRIVSFESPVSPRSRISRAHYYAYGGTRIKLENNLELRPAILAKYQAQAPFEVDLAMDCWFKNIIGFGLGYRTGDAVNFMVKTQMKKMYFGYSYDMNTSHLRTFNTGSHEIFLGLKMPKKKVPNEQDRNQNGRYF
jgi:type IX secretion system PorP/SprF family membrane protein